MYTVSSGKIPGNQHIPLLSPYVDSDGNTIYASFRPGKAVVAITIVLLLLIRPQPFSRHDLPVMGLAIGVPIVAGAFLIGFYPKLTATIAIAALINLLVVCIAEEGFFRWVLQRGLAEWLTKWPWLPTIVVTLLFTTAHTGWAASPVLLALVGVAGLGYALVWQLRGSFWACVLTHWGVNLLHMTLLKYPG
ncbi:CPBP family intramembrane metalloprotease [Microbulbifer bruguierae]|uniref:CPBP family intramembrane metalloprotease n=1 Tax=Microbulbifer bruguierae TaxID=3029061 RepID=A0ABY8N8S1_9GAMM|nr:CPBP family intramembrane metalloprotease [Microbulbifer bruguierae]WGL15300.1 CPBP family intramembrane metalloprotease [Microbulbifer bruguierae]